MTRRRPVVSGARPGRAGRAAPLRPPPVLRPPVRLLRLRHRRRTGRRARGLRRRAPRRARAGAPAPRGEPSRRSSSAAGRRRSRSPPPLARVLAALPPAERADGRGESRDGHARARGAPPRARRHSGLARRAVVPAAPARVLERRATPDDVRRAVHTLRDASFDNISLDLIYGIPGQSAADLDADLADALALAPEHLSCYELEAKPGTRFTHAHGAELHRQAEAMEGYFERVVETLTGGRLPLVRDGELLPRGAAAATSARTTTWRSGAGATTSASGSARSRRWTASGGGTSRRWPVRRRARSAARRRRASSSRSTPTTREVERLMLGLRLDEPFALDGARRRRRRTRSSASCGRARGARRRRRSGSPTAAGCSAARSRRSCWPDARARHRARVESGYHPRGRDDPAWHATERAARAQLKVLIAASAASPRRVAGVVSGRGLRDADGLGWNLFLAWIRCSSRSSSTTPPGSVRRYRLAGLGRSGSSSSRTRRTSSPTSNGSTRVAGRPGSTRSPSARRRDRSRAGFVSLYLVQTAAAHASGRRRLGARVGALVLSGVGVYLGRVERWNSWEVLHGAVEDLRQAAPGHSIRSLTREPLALATFFAVACCRGYALFYSAFRPSADRLEGR